MGDRKQRLAFGVFAAAALVVLVVAFAGWRLTLNSACNLAVGSMTDLAFPASVTPEDLLAMARADGDALAAVVVERQTHASEHRPGAFDERVAAVRQTQELGVEELKSLRRAIDGERTLGEVAPIWREQADRLDGVLDAVLAATEAEHIGGTVDLKGLDARVELPNWNHSDHRESPFHHGLVRGARLIGLRMLVRLEDGGADAALADCVGLLALARDATALPSTHLSGRSARLVAKALCPAAIEQASTKALKSAEPGLRRIAATAPDARFQLRYSRLSATAPFHHEFDLPSRAALPVAVQGVLARRPPRPFSSDVDEGTQRRVRLKSAHDFWHWYGVALAADDSPEARTAALAVERGRLQSSWSLADRSLACGGSAATTAVSRRGWTSSQTAEVVLAAVRERLEGSAPRP